MDFDEIIDRKGTFCTQWDYVEDRFGKKDLLPFTISDTDFAIPEQIQLQLLKRMKHPVFGYTRWNHLEFKSSVVTWFKSRFNTTIQNDWIVYSPSVIYSISQLIDILTQPGEGIITQTPAYDAFFKTISGNKRVLVENKLIYNNGYYTIDFVTLEEQLKKDSNKVLLLCSPHNPTGRVWNHSELSNLVYLCKKYNVFIISDEIHMDILRDNESHISISHFDYDQIALCSSGSKTFNFPGLIFSYALIPDDKLRQEFLFHLKNQHGLSSTSILGMHATMTAYNECNQWVNDLNAYVDKNIEITTEFLKKNLPSIVTTQSEASYLMWLDISQIPLNPDEIQKRLINIGHVAIMDGRTYGGNGDNFLRLNIGCSKYKLLDGLERMKKSLENI